MDRVPIVSPRVRNTLTGLWFAGCTLALTWPTVLQPGFAALGSDKADGMKHLWTLWWMRASVWREGAFPFETTLVNWPNGMDLYPIEPLNGLAAIVLPFLDLVLLNNLLAMVNLFATGMVGWWFGRELTGSSWAGLASGTILLGSSVTAFFVTVGVGELTHMWWLPLGLGMLVRAHRSDTPRAYLHLGLVMVGAVLSCFYLGFFLAVAVLLFCLWQLAIGPDRLRRLCRYSALAGLVLVIVLPISRVFAQSYAAPVTERDDPFTHVFGEKGQQVTDTKTSRLDPTQLFAIGRKPVSEHEVGYGGGRYLGILACLLALVGVVRRPREAVPWLIIALCGVVLSLGSFLTIGGEELQVATGGRYRLPMLWVNRVLELVAEPVNFPVRFLAMTIVAQSALVALAVGRWLVPLVPVAVLEIAWAQLIPWPWPTFVMPNVQALEALADHPSPAIIDISLTLQADSANRALALAGQMAHQHPTNTVPLERVEFFARDGWLYTMSMTLLHDINAVYYDADPAGFKPGYRADMHLLRDAGFEVLLITSRQGRESIPERIVQGLDRLCGTPIVDGPGGAAWAIPPLDPPAVPQELRSWAEYHQYAQKDYARKMQVMAPGP